MQILAGGKEAHFVIADIDISTARFDTSSTALVRVEYLARRTREQRPRDQRAPEVPTARVYVRYISRVFITQGRIDAWLWKYIEYIIITLICNHHNAKYVIKIYLYKSHASFAHRLMIERSISTHSHTIYEILNNETNRRTAMDIYHHNEYT